MGSYVEEFRGVDHLVYAEVLTDDSISGYTTGAVKVLAPVAEIAKTVETASETHYYDNHPAIVIEGEGADTITLTIPVLDLATLADIVGKEYNATKGAYYDGIIQPKYFALGYRLRLTDGTYRYVWRYKGRFGIMDETSQTENAGTDTNNQTLTYTGIFTAYEFSTPTGTQKNQKALVVDERDNKADLSSFFSQVTTCDTLVGKTAYTLTITQAQNTTLTVTRGGVALTSADSVYSGDQLKITVTGGTVTVDGVAFTSGDIHVVTGNTVVESTASA